MLKLDPKNTELLAQKQTVLKQNIQQTTNKLKELKTAQDLYIKSGGNLNSAEYRNLQREIINTENKLKQLKIESSNWTQMSKNLGEISNKLKKVGDAAVNVGRKLTTYLTVPIVSLGTLATKSAIEFESAFTGVEKTVDGTAEQMENLRQGIRDLAKEIPASTTEISAVAEAAGQLGIQTDNVLGFTKTMINMGNATNLSADEAATTLARFANVTKMSQADFDKLGSVIVALGNNFATTEAEIAAMGMNLASAGKQVGMSQPQIMALATALSSVGLEAQAGGTAFSKVMVNMQLAVEKGGKELKNFASVAGMSTKQFTKLFKEDATTAIMKFVEGLSKSGERGKSAIKILDDMGISETRLRDALLRSANASDVMSKAIDLGNKAWKENTALTNEADKRYATTESQILILKNRLLDIGVSIGEIILPYVQKFVDKIGELTEKFQQLSPETQKMIVKIGVIAAAIGPVLIFIGKMISSVSTLVSGLSWLAAKIAAVSGGASGISAILTALTGPVGIIIGAVAALTAAFVYLFNTNEKFKTTIVEMWNNVVKVFDENVKPAFNDLMVAIKDLWENIIKPFGEFLWNFWTPMFVSVFTKIGGVLEVLFSQWGKIFGNAMNILKGLINFIVGVFTGDWKRAWQGIVDVVKNIFGVVVNLVKIPINTIISLLNGAISGINQIKIPDWVPGVGGKGINIPLIPKLAKGGIVDSATLAMIGEGRSAEAVIPLDRTLTKYMAEALKLAGGNRNIVMNFYPQQMTEAELERAFNYVDRRFGILY